MILGTPYSPPEPRKNQVTQKVTQKWPKSVFSGSPQSDSKVTFWPEKRLELKVTHLR